MKNKTKTTLIIAGIVLVALLLILIAGCLKCGDGICQRGEERKGSCPEDCITSPSNTPVKSINFLENIRGRLDLSKEDVIVFDSKGPDGYYDVFMMNMDGTKRKCLTCDKVQVPQKHNGQPAWHPSGDFIVFQSVDPELKGLPKILSEREKVLTGPGAGVNNNLWLTDKDGERFWQLTEVEDKKGVLHPHFSHDGKKLIWAEIVDQKVEPSGDWVIKIADVFIGENSAKLKNIIVLKPGNMRFFETHGFSADDSKILFSATPDGYYSNLDIYSYDLFTKELKQLTGPDSEWDEHAQYSPDGKKIVWMSSKGISQKIQQYKVKTDYWIMNSNGENKKRITFFNDPQDKNYIEGGVAAADNAWTSDGKNILGYIIVREHQADKNVLIEFENGDERPICGNGICEEGETAENCPEDCESVKYKLTCISTYTTNWHWGKCRECKRGYTLDKCETRGHIISRETCEKNYKTECLENPKCARGDEEIGREECGGENKKTECKVKGLEKIGEGCFPKWSPDGSLIAYTKEINNNDYQIYTMKPDGSDIKCLTCDRPGLANTRWRGQPYWHPSGEYIIFTAETTKYPRKGIGTTARPGIGRNHNIWIMTSDGSKFWQITDYPDNWGVIRPSFSHDGKTLLWNEEFMMEKYPHGKPGVDKHPGCWWGSENQKYRKGEELCAWRIKLASISFESKELGISNIRHIDPPDGFTVIEIAGFMPNDIGFIYSYCDIKKQGGRCVWGDIYTSDLNGSISSFWQLTDSFHVHDESPEFSPDGKKLIWATSAGGDPGEGEEVWLMDAEGGNKIRLTYFADPNHNEYDPIGRQITEMTWSPDGKNVVFGHVSDEKRGSPHLPSTLYKLTFKGACGNQIISRPVCGNGICESGETAENCLEDCKKIYNVKSITTIKEKGGRVDWSHSGNNLIAFDKEDDDGYFDVYIMKPDGSDEQCLTCNKSELPKHHIGQPAWHPSGKYIVFQAVNPELEIYPPSHRVIEDIVTNPGGGTNNNLWLMDNEATKFWQLTNVEDGLGVLHPHFSKDGSMLTWAEKISWQGYKWGQWVIKIADFNVSYTDPTISNIRTCRPENLKFYETHGFFPDATKIIFTGLEQDDDDEALDIYIMDIFSGDCSKAQILTDGSIDQWDEHAHISPDGSKIVWMSSMDIDQEVEQFKFKSDLWIMNADGSNKQRLTYFNDPGASEYVSGGIVVSDSSWNREGNKLVVFLIDRSGKDEHSIVMIDFENGDERPICGNGICEEGETVSELDIYELNLESNQLKRLLTEVPNEWDEHAEYSPDGKKIGALVAYEGFLGMKAKIVMIEFE